MILIDLFREHGGARLGRALGMSIGGGVLGAGIVALANLASAGERSGGSLTLSLAFVGALGLMFVCNRWSAQGVVEIFEDIQRHLRIELARGLREAPLRTVERLGEEPGRAIADLTFISTIITQLVTVVQQCAFLLSVTVIIATISGKALLIWLVNVVVIVRWLKPALDQIRDIQKQQSHRLGAYEASVDELLGGIQQLKLDTVIGDRVVDRFESASAALADGRLQVAGEVDRTYLSAKLIYVAIGFGLAAFAPPGLIGLGPAVGYEMLILLALANGPLFDLIEAVPVVIRAQSSLESVADVLGRLQVNTPAEDGVDGHGFESIRLHRQSFTYPPSDPAEPGFTVGPIDLTIRSGSLVFVTGGNGSGKTTLMKMLLGLYPTSGSIYLDGRRVLPSQMAKYRGLFSAIFLQQTLFDRPYGLEVAPARVEALLDRFDLTEAVRFNGDSFGKLELSSGQQMRLAMVVALLEDRPVYVFDEWTANQDPETTWMYYDTLLPELIADGKTVVAVSHDDRFFDRADHLVRLDQGRLSLDKSAVRPPASE